MNRSELHPVELLLLTGLVALEAAAVLIVALVALLLAVASWRPAASPSAPSPAAVTEAPILLPVAASTDAPAPALHPLALVAEQLEALPCPAADRHREC